MTSIHKVYDEVKDNESIPQLVRVPVLLTSALVFQGTLYMDRTERATKVCLTLLLAVPMKRWAGSDRPQWFEAVAVAHLLNFLFNGHPWAFANHTLESNPIHTSNDDFDRWVRRLERLGKRSDSIAAIAVYGSHVRGVWDEGSDLDVRVVRYPGRVNGAVASLLVCRERAQAAISFFPLDIYLLDGTGSLNRLRDDEQPMVLVDKEGWL